MLAGPCYRADVHPPDRRSGGFCVGVSWTVTTVFVTRFAWVKNGCLRPSRLRLTLPGESQSLSSGEGQCGLIGPMPLINRNGPPRSFLATLPQEGR